MTTIIADSSLTKPNSGTSIAGTCLKRVAFTGKQTLCIEESTCSELRAEDVRVRGTCSIMSTGTENIVFNRLFAADTHWDKWVKYPFYPGYGFVGEIIEIGSAVGDRSVGQRVALRAGHASEHVVSQHDAMIIPHGISDEEAVWFALAKITYSGARAADYTIGQKVLIVGGGPIGQLAARWALAAGAGQVCLLDPLPLRQELALTGGVHQVIGKRLDEAFDDIDQALSGKPDVVIDSTGIAAVFTHCLTACADRGKVIILGDTGAPSEQFLSSDVITRRIQIIGAHDGHFENEPPCQLFWQFVKDGRFSLQDMNTHHFDLSNAQAAYDLANAQRGETMGIIFNLQK
ncbi:MAG: zinc-binding alcohol dehydrogenase [Planctomycetes bacterium]|nr:zinc-binding alcohol dehydrogenase [Planctomycetota bacterium]